MNTNLYEKYKNNRQSSNKKNFHSIADSVKTRKEKLSNEVFNNPDFCWELAKIKAQYRENKMSLDFSQSMSSRNIISERDSIYDNVFNNEDNEIIKQYSRIEEENNNYDVNENNNDKKNDSYSNLGPQETSNMLLTDRSKNNLIIFNKKNISNIEDNGTPITSYRDNNSRNERVKFLSMKYSDTKNSSDKKTNHLHFNITDNNNQVSYHRKNSKSYSILKSASSFVLRDSSTKYNIKDNKDYNYDNVNSNNPRIFNEYSHSKQNSNHNNKLPYNNNVIKNKNLKLNNNYLSPDYNFNQIATTNIINSITNKSNTAVIHSESNNNKNNNILKKDPSFISKNSKHSKSHRSLNTNANTNPRSLLKTKTRKIVYSQINQNSKAQTHIPFSKLSPKQKFRRIYLKITIVLLFNYIWNRMKFYGLNVLRADIEDEIQNFEKSKIKIFQESKTTTPICNVKNIYITPDNSFFKFWNIIRIILHMYSVTYMVFLICVEDRLEVFTVSWFLDYFVELLYLIDMIIIFFTAYHQKGDLIISNKKIALKYLTRWFIIDLIAIFPFEMLYDEYGSKPLYLASNMSFHRLIRILRFVRIYKLFRYYENTSTIKKIIQLKFIDTVLKKLRMNAGISRLINTLFIVLMLSHIFACIFYYSAKLNNFKEDTWIARNNFQDLEMNARYLASVYYSLTVVTTVGFGDITSVTVFEKILTCLWMIIGVAFYSFVISNLSSIISSLDFHSTLLEKKIDTLNDFAQKLAIPDYLYLRIKKVYEENDNQYFIQDENQILEDLPYNLKVETLFHIHHDKINSIVYFLDRSINLVVDVISKWKSLCFDENEFIYLSGETPFDIYFVTNGCLLYIDNNGNNITKFRNGGMVGEIEPVLGIQKRIITARATQSTVLNSLKVDDFCSILVKYPIDLQETIKMVKRKFIKYKELIKSLSEKSKKDTQALHEINEYKNTMSYLKKLNYLSLEHYYENNDNKENKNITGVESETNFPLKTNLSKENQNNINNTSFLKKKEQKLFGDIQCIMEEPEFSQMNEDENSDIRSRGVSINKKNMNIPTLLINNKSIGKNKELLNNNDHNANNNYENFILKANKGFNMLNKLNKDTSNLNSDDIDVKELSTLAKNKNTVGLSLNNIQYNNNIKLTTEDLKLEENFNLNKKSDNINKTEGVQAHNNHLKADTPIPNEGINKFNFHKSFNTGTSISNVFELDNSHLQNTNNIPPLKTINKSNSNIVSGNKYVDLNGEIISSSTALFKLNFFGEQAFKNTCIKIASNKNTRGDDIDNRNNIVNENSLQSNSNCNITDSVVNDMNINKINSIHNINIPVLIVKSDDNNKKEVDANKEIEDCLENNEKIKKKKSIKKRVVKKRRKNKSNIIELKDINFNEDESQKDFGNSMNKYKTMINNGNATSKFDNVSLERNNDLCKLNSLVSVNSNSNKDNMILKNVFESIKTNDIEESFSEKNESSINIKNDNKENIDNSIKEDQNKVILEVIPNHKDSSNHSKNIIPEQVNEESEYSEYSEYEEFEETDEEEEEDGNQAILNLIANEKEKIRENLESHEQNKANINNSDDERKSKEAYNFYFKRFESIKKSPRKSTTQYSSKTENIGNTNHSVNNFFSSRNNSDSPHKEYNNTTRDQINMNDYIREEDSEDDDEDSDNKKKINKKAKDCSYCCTCKCKNDKKGKKIKTEDNNNYLDLNKNKKNSINKSNDSQGDNDNKSNNSNYLSIDKSNSSNSNSISSYKKRINKNKKSIKRKNNLSNINTSSNYSQKKLNNYNSFDSKTNSEYSRKTLEADDNSDGSDVEKYRSNVIEIVRYFDEYINLVNTLNQTFNVLNTTIINVKENHREYFNKMIAIDERLAYLEDRQDNIENGMGLSHDYDNESEN